MWKRLSQRLRQKGVAIALAMVLAMAVVDRRSLCPLQVPRIVLRIDSIPPCYLRMRSRLALPEQLWLN